MSAARGGVDVPVTIDRLLRTRHGGASTRGRSLVLLTVLSLLASLLFAGASTAFGRADAAHAAGPTWTCSPSGFLFQYPNASTTQIYQVNLVSGASSQVGQIGSRVNAVGYNTLDDYMYGWDVDLRQMVQIAADGSVTALGDPTGTGGAGGGVVWNTGDFDDAGHFFLTNQNPNPVAWYEIDYVPGSPTYGQVIASGTKTIPSGYGSPADWSWIGGVLYSVAFPTGSQTPALLRLDPATSTTAVVGSLPFSVPFVAGNGTNVYGATYADDSGNLYASYNGGGQIYRIDPDNLSNSFLLSNGPISSNNDGARCANAPIPTIRVVKQVEGRVQDADQFTVGLNTSGGSTLTSATTSGAQTTTSTANWPVEQGSTYTITDAMAAGSPSGLGLYATSLVCVDAAGNVAPTGGGSPNWTLTVANPTDYTCTVTNSANATRSYTVAKTSSTATALPGDTIDYTVEVTNTGPAPYTAANPASFTDDLSAVLDDATYNGDASGGATVTGSTLSWSGALGVGETVTITYSVTVDDPDTGDRELTNTVAPTGPGGSCVSAADCTTTTTVPGASYSVAKSASTTSAMPGDTVTYTVTVTNTSGIAYTAADPASFTDDLSAVLDDATYNGDATGGATVTGTTLTWSGPLPARGTTTITYSVTVDDPDTGDHVLTNAVVPTGPGGDCATPDGCTTTTPVASYTLAKSASATTAVAGDVLTYTVAVTNTGDVDYTLADPASFTDDLSAVLDDATYNGDATGGATVAGSTLTWSGALAAGATVTITYTVTVNDPVTGDGLLTNAVVPTAPGGGCEAPGGCTTTTPLMSYTVAKTASVTTAMPGDTVEYAVVVTNTSDTDFTTADPASFTDDLSAVLDDATYNGDATGGATLTGTSLNWSGALAAGTSVTITYSVTVDDPDEGDHVLTNVVVPTGPGGECATADGCTTTTPIASYAVTKAASVTSAAPGTSVTYTVTVTNTGDVDYTEADPASVTDDLSDVLDDATYNGDATGGATVAGGTLTWSGALAAGATVTITYSVTVNDPDTGDHVLANAVVPTAPGGECETAGDCTTTTPVASYTVAKSASATSVAAGDVLTYVLTVTNTGEVAYTADDPASFTDDLSDVLDDATYLGDATGGATLTGTTLSWSGALPVAGTVTITYSVRVDDPDTGDHVLTNAVVPTGPGGTCATADGCTTTTPVASYTVAKIASAVDVLPGGVVRYDVTVENTGEVDYTSANPASFIDDLADVLDDATYNGDATSGAAVAGSTLTWSGALPVGATVTITYSVTVNDPDTGDHLLTNAVIPTGPGGECVTDVDCTTTTAVASYTVSKVASVADAMPGDTVRYEVTVVNTGQVHFTDASPASFTDDLSDVLDDATYNEDASGGATVTGVTLSWSGALPIGESVTVSYSVTVNDPVTGDHVLTNAVVPTGPGGDCATADGCTTTTPVGSLHVTKTTPATDVLPGAVVPYTIEVTNTGQVDYTAAEPASFTDDLSAVLDDATYNGDLASSTGQGASFTPPVVSWSGPLAVGDTVTITYSVTVNDPATGDNQLDNTVVTPPGTGGNCPPGSTDPDCVANVPAGSFVVSKTVSATSAVSGDTLTYTLVATNTGDVAYTDAQPASFSDDLSHVLDDATYNGDVTGGATVVGDTLTWAGPLGVGESVTVTYTVTVNDPDTGDHLLTNAIVPTAPGGGCATADGCTTTTPVAGYTVAKTVDAIVAGSGQTVRYTLSVTNVGQVAYTDAEPASFTDDLSEVLDDATYNGDASEGATVGGTTLSWSGPLAVGESVQITYSVTVDTPVTGDYRLDNTVVPTGPGGSCTVPEDCVTSTPILAYVVKKTASQTTAEAGDVIRYTVAVTNVGSADYTAANPASFRDDLSDALRVAEYNDDATDGAAYDAPVLSWAGELAVGETITVTYSMTVRAGASGTITNIVVTPPGSGANCAPGSSDPDCTTTTTVPPVPGASVHTGGSVIGTSLPLWMLIGAVWVGLTIAAVAGYRAFRRREGS